MANKLKNLSVTSVDLVDQGANPDAHIRLFKRKEQEQEADPDIGLFEKFSCWLAKGLAAAFKTDVGENVENDVGTVEKEAATFSENVNREQLREITSEMFDCCYALSDSFCSIICDNTLDADTKSGLIRQSLDEFSETIQAAAEQWAAGQKMSKPQNTETGIQKSVVQQQIFEKLWERYQKGGEPSEPQDTGTSNITEQEVTDTMKIDKGRMTPEELATLAEFEKKYGVADNDDPGSSTGVSGGAGTDSAVQDGGVAKGAETHMSPIVPVTDSLHPEVRKALADFQELTKRQNAEVEELKKSLELERLTVVAKKYEVLGKKADDLAAKLYELKKAGGTVYDDYVSLLDENVTTLENSGLFGEIGKNTQGSAGIEQAIGIKAAEVEKAAAGGMAAPDAIIKAWEENPELAAQYEAEYMGGMRNGR